MNEKINWFDHCEVDTWSPLWFDDFIEQLGYTKTPELKMYWLLPGKELADGLRIISTDSDTNLMCSVVDKVKRLVVYFDHDDCVAGVQWDDVVSNPVAQLPKILSSVKVQHIKKKGEDLPDFYRKLKDRTIENENFSHVGEEKGTNSGDGSENDTDFLDSDYEFMDGDDDLFVDHVDENVVDQGEAKGKKIAKGKKAVGSRLRGSEVAVIN